MERKPIIQKKYELNLSIEEIPFLKNESAIPLYKNYLKSIFPESKIKNLVYHSTRHEFDEYDIDRGDLGIHFAKKEVSAGVMGSQNTKINLLNLTNPLILKDNGAWNFRFIGEVLVKEGIIKDVEYLDIDSQELSLKEENSKLRELLKEKGYDGIKYLNRREGINGGILDTDSYQESFNLTDEEFKERYGDAVDSYIAFSSEQIHILGSQKDQEMFDKFIKTDSS